MKTYARELALFFTLLLACPSGHADEQDNWYLANEWSVSNAGGVPTTKTTSGKRKYLRLQMEWSAVPESVFMN